MQDKYSGQSLFDCPISIRDDGSALLMVKPLALVVQTSAPIHPYPVEAVFVM